MSILVTGATGFVGRAILQELTGQSSPVRILVRDPSSASARAAATAQDVQLCQGDIQDPHSLKSAVHGATAVIHLVGIIGEAGKQTFERVHVEGTRNVVEATRNAEVPRYIHMSALGTREGAASRYHQTKWAAEQIVRASHLDWTIFRPSLIYGPHDQFVNLFARISRFSPVIPIPGSATALYQPVSITAVAHAFVRALAKPESIGKTFDLCGPERLTLPQIVDVVLRVTGRRRLKLQIPGPIAEIQAVVLEYVFGRLLRKTPPLSRDQLVMLSEDNIGNSHTAKTLFDLKQDSFREGIARYLGSPRPGFSE